MSLTPKQARFVEEYLIDLNATQAAIRAGYSEATAQQIGSENLCKPVIQEAIQAAKQERSERTKIDQDWVLKRLAALADSDIRRVSKWDAAGVYLTDSDVLSWEDAYTINEVILEETIKETEDGKELVMKRQKRIKQADKKPPLELIGKHLGMFTDKIKLSGDQDAPPIQITFKRPDAPS
jgi:phage terminase small subunit